MKIFFFGRFLPPVEKTRWGIGGFPVFRDLARWPALTRKEKAEISREAFGVYRKGNSSAHSDLPVLLRRVIWMLWNGGFQIPRLKKPPDCKSGGAYSKEFLLRLREGEDNKMRGFIETKRRKPTFTLGAKIKVEKNYLPFTIFSTDL